MTRNMLNLIAIVHFGLDPFKAYPARASHRRRAIERLVTDGFLGIWRNRLFVTGAGYAAMRGGK